MSKLKILITGGAGFIGSNAADYYLSKGNKVVVVDNLSRKGTEKNLKWLQTRYPTMTFYRTDIRKGKNVTEIVKDEKPDAVLHLAAQVAVTTSVQDPIVDKEINLDGTINVLESVRAVSKKIPVIYSSTNKVYGGLELEVKERGRRYELKNSNLRKNGIGENENLDFHSPYGCSKGAADQYVRDYYRIYGIPTVVFRQSCIYGPRQFGNEDQGWVMHFTRLAVEGKVLNIYGDGKQVRDVLEVSDLIAAYDLCLQRIDKCQGEIYSMGGGVGQSVSLLELIDILEQKLDIKLKLNFGSWRPGDQKVYISDIRKFKKLGWKPKVSVDQGLNKLLKWAKEVVELG